MTDSSRLEQAASLLRTSYGAIAPSGEDSSWHRFLRELLGLTQGHAANKPLTELFRCSPLSSPGQTAAVSAGNLVEILQPIPRGPQKASVIRAVAAWWIAQFGDEESPACTRGVESYRTSLREIRGLGPATVDQLLLFAADLPVFPVDRTALRVAVRHGWLDLPVEDDEAQAFFVNGQDQCRQHLQELSRLLTLVGESHCGREPKCNGCPLESMLPAGGPRSPESC